MGREPSDLMLEDAVLAVLRDSLYLMRLANIQESLGNGFDTATYQKILSCLNRLERRGTIPKRMSESDGTWWWAESHSNDGLEKQWKLRTRNH